MESLQDIVNAAIEYAEADSPVSIKEETAYCSDSETEEPQPVANPEEVEGGKVKAPSKVKGRGGSFFSPYRDLLNTRGKTKACTKREVKEHLLKNHRDKIIANLKVIGAPITDDIIIKTANIIAGKNHASLASLIPTTKAFLPTDLKLEDLGIKPNAKPSEAEAAVDAKESEEEHKEMVNEIKEEAEKGNKTSQVRKLTKTIFATIVSNPRAEWKKRLKAFFTEMNIETFNQVPPQFTEDYNKLLKDYKLDTPAFMDKLESILEHAKLEVGKINYPRQTPEEFEHDVAVEEARQQQAPKSKPKPKAVPVHNKSDTIKDVNKPVQAKMRPVVNKTIDLVY